MQARFIRATDTYTTKDSYVSAPYLRRAFTLPFTPTEARLTVATGGFYELYLNGEHITKGHLAPYIANPDQMVCYDTYDLTGRLLSGDGVLGLILGNGFANQLAKSWSFSEAPFRAPLTVAFELYATDGKQEFTVSSDTDVRVHPSHITFDMYRYGTHMDMRRYIDGWCSPDFDDSAWAHAALAPAPRGELIPCTADPIRTRCELTPKDIRRVGDFCYLRTAFRGGVDCPETYVKEGYLYDFGLARAGVCRLRVRGERGQRITLRHGERLADDGTFTLNSIYTFKPDYAEYIHLFQTDEFILRGGEEEILLPPFTYHGFRYVLVEGITEEQATEELLTYEVFHSDIRERAGLSASDGMLTELFRMADAADRTNFHYFPTDCPHREKNGWTGDLAASAERYLSFYDCRDSLSLWLRALCLAQREDGALPAICPTTGWGFAWGNGPFYDLVLIELCYHDYVYHGTTEMTQLCADAMVRYLSYIASRRDERGLVAVGLPDWAQPYYAKIGFRAPLELTDSATVMDMARKAALLLRLIGREEDAATAARLGDETYTAIRTHLIDFDTMCAKGHSPTGQAYLLSLGVFREDEYDRAYRTLLDIIREDGGHAVCGVIGLRHIFPVLIQGGNVDLALHMITREDAPSYGSMAARGATALCEAPDENGCQESENHHFLGDFRRALLADMIGLRVNPHLCDVNEILFAPHIPSTLSSAEGWIDRPAGRAIGGFRREEDRTVVYVTLPEGAHGTFRYGAHELPLSVGYNEFCLEEGV